MPDRPASRPGRAAAAAVLAVLALALAMPAATADATERGRAERLYTKGLAELHAGQTDVALALFDEAVAADPDDVRALYYRALGHGHAGQYAEAAADLERVVAADDPAIPRDQLEYGYALYRLKRYDAAAAALEGAAAEPSTATEAQMLLGIVETRRGNHDAARAALAEVEAADPSRAVPARYYQGLAAWRAGDTETAVEQFTWVSTQGGDSAYAREATEFLDRLEDGGARRYRLYAGLAFEYDSNVALAPDDDFTASTVYGISDESDGRAVITAGGRFGVVNAANFHLSVGYDFLQSLHFDLERFDVQTHTVGGQARYLAGPVTLGVAANYEHSLLDEESLLNGGTVLPWISIDEGDFGYTEIYYRMRRRDFVEAPFDPVRDSINHAVGARQFFSLLGERNRSVFVGYRFDTDEADEMVGRPYEFNGHQFELGVTWAIDENLAIDGAYAYKLEDYTSASLFRDDDEHQVIVRAEKRMSDCLWLTGSYVFRRNDSDQVSFDYTRHITSLGAEWRY